MPSDKDALFFESRSEAVLATCAWLGPIMNRVHGTQFSEKFWTRALLEYAVAAYNQKAHFDEESFRYPISFEAINGWAPPDRKKIIQDVALTSLRSLKGAYSAKDIARSLLGVSRVAFGTRSEIFGLELAAAPLSFNWIPYLGRPDSKVRKSLRTASQDAPTLHYRNVCRNVPRLYVEFFGNLLRLFERAQSLPITDIFVEH